MKKWYLGTQNDGLFIINTPPRPSTDDAFHERSNGPSLVINVTAMEISQAQAIVDAHNAALDAAIKELEVQLEAVTESRNAHQETCKEYRAELESVRGALRDVLPLVDDAAYDAGVAESKSGTGRWAEVQFILRAQAESIRRFLE